MVNKETGLRELCYVVQVSDIQPIEGKDRVECAVIGGWKTMVRKGTFKPGSLGIYFEIDSLCPQTDAFAFLASKNYKVKTQKYGNFYSQGLLMPAEDLGWVTEGSEKIYDQKNGIKYSVGDFLTEALGVTYYDANDRKRKAKPVDKYKSMVQRMGKKASKQPYRWLLRHNWGKKFLYLFYGQKKLDSKKAWPAHIATKTDVERIQNMIFVLKDKSPFVATEKIDGTSCSIMCEKNFLGQIKQYICSRNVVFEASSQKCFYDTNVYYEAYYKYNLGEKIIQILKDYNLPNVALQMEIYGKGIQKRDYSTKEHKIAVFHIVSNGIKFPMEKTVEICEKYGIPHVPILDTNYILPNDIQELQSYVEGEGSSVDGLPKEGIVFYSKDGQQYFKFVSPNFLIKYHG